MHDLGEEALDFCNVYGTVKFSFHIQNPASPKTCTAGKLPGHLKLLTVPEIPLFLY